MKRELPYLRHALEDSLDLKRRILQDPTISTLVETIVVKMVATFEADGKVLFCGNGGSAADAQHLAAELSGRFYLDREPLFAEALHGNGSFVTATANDYSFSEVFARMVRAIGRKGDVLIAISTSGNSPNVLRALEDARSLGLICVGWTGRDGGRMADLCDYCLQVPSTDTPRIQEAHMLIGHVICAEVERRIFGHED